MRPARSSGAFRRRKSCNGSSTRLPDNAISVWDTFERRGCCRWTRIMCWTRVSKRNWRRCNRGPRLAAFARYSRIAFTGGDYGLRCIRRERYSTGRHAQTIETKATDIASRSRAMCCRCVRGFCTTTASRWSAGSPSKTATRSTRPSICGARLRMNSTDRIASVRELQSRRGLFFSTRFWARDWFWTGGRAATMSSSARWRKSFFRCG